MTNFATEEAPPISPVVAALLGNPGQHATPPPPIPQLDGNDEPTGDRDNVSEMRMRDGSTTRQQRRQTDRDRVKANQHRQAVLAEMKKVAPQIYELEDKTEDEKIQIYGEFKAFHEPITRGEAVAINRGMNETYKNMYERVSQDLRRALVSQQALLRVLVDKGIIDKADFEAAARFQLEWNAQVNQICRGLDTETITLRDAIQDIRVWNENPGHPLKINAHHIDLPQRLLNDEGHTLEEKLMIAQEFDLPQGFLDAARAREFQRYGEDAASEAATAPQSFEESDPED